MRSNQHRVLIGAATVVTVAAFVPTVFGAPAPQIKPTSIAGAKLGLGATTYKRLLGKPYRFEAAKGGDFTLPGFQQPSNYTRIVFPKRKINVYFKDGVDKAIQITTWNKAYKTVEGVGPCSTMAELSKAYGARLKPNPGIAFHPNGGIVGRSLIFVLSNPYSNVTAVSLYDGSHPGWNKPGHELRFAEFVASPPDQVPCI